MAVANFEELCKGYCEIAGFPAPSLAPDAHGIEAFHLRLRDVAVTVGHEPAKALERAFVVIEFGPVPKDREEDAWPALLDANFLMLRDGMPIFSRNPVNGDVLLQMSCAFSRVTALELVQLVDAFVGVAIDWRRPDQP